MVAVSNSPVSGEEAAASAPRWRRELSLLGICLGCGILLPAIIYAVGVQLLGAYGGGPHIGSFYGDFLRNLGTGTLRTWFIVFAPYLLLSTLRLIFWPWRNKLPANQPGPSDDVVDDIAQPTARGQRREPFVAP